MCIDPPSVVVEKFFVLIHFHHTSFEEISSATADESFPLWWVVATIYFIIIIIWNIIASGEHRDWQKSVEGIHKYQNYVMRQQILYFTVFVFFVIASGMAGGIGYCRRAFV